MKLSPETLSILKNFAAINSGLWVEPGSVIKTVERSSKSILATATVKDTFPKEFCIYDLNEFLSVVTLHNEPDLQFEDTHVTISALSGRSKLTYRYSSKEMIIVPPSKNLNFPSPEITFDLSEEDFKWVNNVAKVLKSPHIAIRSEGTDLTLVTYDNKNDSTPTESLTLNAKGNGDTFNMFYNTDDFSRIIPGSYNVEVSSKRISKLTHTGLDLVYYIAFDKDSTYN